MRRLGKYEKRAKMYAAYRSAVECVPYYFFVVKHKTPIWAGSGYEWVVYLKSEIDLPGYSRITGHHAEKDLAYKMVLDFCMESNNLSWEELKLKAAVAGIDVC